MTFNIKYCKKKKGYYGHLNYKLMKTIQINISRLYFQKLTNKKLKKHPTLGENMSFWPNKFNKHITKNSFFKG